MNFRNSPLCRISRRVFPWLFAALMIGGTGTFAASVSGQKTLKMKLSADRLTAEVTVPEGVGSVTLQKYQRDGGWQKVVTQTAVVGVMKFTLPATNKSVQWRALGWYEVETASRSKFPARFYKGKSKFGPVKANGGSWLGSRALAVPTAGIDAGAVTNADTPVEADIWKVDGNTVYFFNQLRGLQVLDLTNPADPRLTASLRLPAVGQDLYVLPGATTADRTIILLTEGWTQDGGQWTRIQQVKVSGGKAEIGYSQEVTGSLADSRLAGNRLILATTENAGTGGTVTNGGSVKCHLSEWLLAPGQAPVAAAETLIEGTSPLISSGPEWLALAVHPDGQWDVADVAVFAVRPSGLIRMGDPVRTEGAIADKYAMQWSGNVLTTISERYKTGTTWSPTTVLETFRAWAPEEVPPVADSGRLGRLELATGESLHATRFAGNKAYVVTFLQTDPLWVVDLSDPAKPLVAGQLAVPGWSSRLEPIGDMLFAIGWESGTVVASLFDVANPAAPALLRRLSLGAAGTFSQAMWDDQALKILPDAGLALIPLNTYDPLSGQWLPLLQLLDIDTVARDLRLRGEVAHAFDARRADLLGETVVSISQRVLVTADITDRDAPDMLAEVSLAWPVDRVLDAGDYLLEIEDGGRWYPSGSRATVRVSPANAPEQILAETDLGDGSVRAAECRNGKLYILRDQGASVPIYYLNYMRTMDGTGSSEGPLVMDIYDTTAVPTLTLVGSCSVPLPSGAQVATDRLLWPQPDRPAVVLDYRFVYWFCWYPPPVMIKPVVNQFTIVNPFQPRPSTPAYARPYWVPETAPCLVLFDVSQAAAPVAAEPVSLGPVGTMLNGISEAANGRIVLGTSYWKNPQNGSWLDSSHAVQSALVIKVESAGPPFVRPLVDLPGELFAVTELDANGFYAFTRTPANDAVTTLQVSACDGFDAFLVTSLNVPASAAITAGGKRIFVAKADGVERHLLNDKGALTTEPTLKIGWTPDALRWFQGTLTGSLGNSLFAAPGEALSATAWAFPAWNLGLDRLTIAADGDLLVPFGDYGVERLAR